jgi:LysR family transcriptional regulator, glycine cleavage system transcriptional activator
MQDEHTATLLDYYTRHQASTQWRACPPLTSPYLDELLSMARPPHAQARRDAIERRGIAYPCGAGPRRRPFRSRQAGPAAEHLPATPRFRRPTMRRLPPLNALQIFETVARYRSFTRAADHLCLTQGAVSRQILALEDYYKFPLFKRHAKGLTLTAEGEQLLPAVKESFTRIEEMSLRLTRQRTDLALKVPTCVMRWMLPKIMQFQAEYADLHVQITTTWQHDVDFEAEPFDAAIVYGTSAGAGVQSLPLFDERLTPVCAPQLVKDKPLARVADLARHTLLHPTRDHRDWKMWLEHVDASHDVDAALGPTFDTLDLATNAALQGFGVAISDLVLIEEDVAAQRLVRPFDAVLATGARYYFVFPDSVAHQQKVDLFRAWLAAHCAP